MPKLFAQIAGISLLALATSLPGASLAQEGYHLRPGDTLRIEVLEDPTLNRTVLVAPDGRISMPLVGGVAASGRTIETVQGDIAAKLGPNFATAPTVYVALDRQSEPRGGTGGASGQPTIEVYVMGEAVKPGKIEVTRGATVLQALAQMGGFSKFAAVKRIQLRHGAENIAIDYKAIEAGTSNVGATVLSAGDVIIIPQRKLFE